MISYGPSFVPALRLIVSNLPSSSSRRSQECERSSTHAVDREYVWVIQRTRSLRFLLESLQTIRILRIGCRQDFDCNVAIESRIARQVHFAHPAFAKF